jgi:arylsulfatase A-like enzyme
MEDTLIIFTSDHGDYLGDHYLGDKEFFHEESVRIPLIVYNPSPEADSTRRTETDALVESIDILPTILEGLGGDVPGHILEGRSLVPIIRGEHNGDWRTSVLSEFDYSFLPVRNWLGMPVDRCRMYMIRTAEWKYIFMEDFSPILFNLTEDPRETVDVSGDPKNSRILSELNGQLFERLRTLRYRPTLPDSVLEDWREDKMNPGLKIGAW